MKCHFCNVVGVSQSEADQASEIVQGYDTLCLSCAESLKVVEQNIDYKETILNLFSMLKMANSSDSKNKLTWQKSIDANKISGFYGRIYDAIECIAGIEILRHWASTGEVDLTLVNRK